MTIDTAQIISMVVGVLLPILVGLVTKVVTSPAFKAVLLFALSAVSGFLTEFLVVGTAFDWQQALFSWLTTFIVAVAMHFGLYSPTGISQKAQEIPLTGRSNVPADPYGDR